MCTNSFEIQSPYGCFGCETRLDLFVIDDAALFGIDEQDPSRVEALLDEDVFRVGCPAPQPPRP